MKLVIFLLALYIIASGCDVKEVETLDRYSSVVKAAEWWWNVSAEIPSDTYDISSYAFSRELMNRHFIRSFLESQQEDLHLSIVFERILNSIHDVESRQVNGDFERFRDAMIDNTFIGKCRDYLSCNCYFKNYQIYSVDYQTKYDLDKVIRESRIMYRFFPFKTIMIIGNSKVSIMNGDEQDEEILWYITPCVN
jgi:hypothetical protein